MALSPGRRRALAVLAALPGLALAAWWTASDSYLDSWRARESALEARVAQFADVAGPAAELRRLRARLTEAVHAVRTAKQSQVPMPDLAPLLQQLPADRRWPRLVLEPGSGTVTLWLIEEEPGDALRVAEALRESGRLGGVILMPERDGSAGVRSLLVRLPEAQP